MQTTAVTAIANPNIAFIKYWGNLDQQLRIPANGSISINLAGLETRTTVYFDPDLPGNQLTLNGEDVSGEGLERVSRLLDRVRQSAGIDTPAKVTSENNFPTGSGIASSAAAFAALALAASAAAGLNPDSEELSRLARTGSGSASRSVPAGFVEWLPGKDHQTSFAQSFAPADHWALADCIAVVSREHKATGSTGGHALADTSPLQKARLSDAGRRLEICRQAIIDRDFETFANIVELDSNMMHAVMITSDPILFYWLPATLAVMQSVQAWRRSGIPACFTLDAGPNVHVITLQDNAQQVKDRLLGIPGVLEVLVSQPGGAARLV